MENQFLMSGDLQVNLLTQQVSFQDKPVALPILSYKLLVNLMSAWPQTQSQDELISSIWGKVQVQNTTLNQRIKLLRQALKAQGCDPACVALVRGVGYRFAEEVHSLKSAGKAEQEFTATPEKDITATAKSRKSNKSSRWKIYLTLITVLSVVSILLQWSDRQVMDTDSGQVLASPDQLRQSITVLPFVANSFANNTDNYLGQSFSADVLNLLTEVKSLQVISHNRITRKKLTALEISEIGKKLKVDNVLKGSITLAGEGVNVDIKLLATSKNEILWSKKYYVDKSGLFFLKTDIARDIKTFLLPNDDQELNYNVDVNMINPKAYDFYLKAMDYYRRNTTQDNRHAQSLISNAYQLSPSCLNIITGYAAVLNRGMRFGSHDYALMAQAKNLANKAITLYPQLSPGYVELANNYLLQQDNVMALKYFNKALSLSPENVTALTGLIKIQISSSQFKQALVNISLLKILDPGSTTSLLLSGNRHFSLFLFAQAEQDYKAVIKVEPDNIDALLGLAKTSLMLENFGDAKKYHSVAENFSQHSVKAFYFYMEMLFAQQDYQVLIQQVALKKTSKNNRYTDKINKLSLLAELLLHPGKNAVLITNKVNDYQQIFNNTNKLTAREFSYLFVLLKSSSQTKELIHWQNKQSKFISELQQFAG